MFPSEGTAALSDEAILGIDDGPGFDAGSEVSSIATDTDVEPRVETQQPDAVETPSSETETLTQPGQQDKPQQQPDKAQQPANDSQATQEQEAIKAQALDVADEVFTTGDAAGQMEIFHDLFGDNPGGLADATWNSMQYLAQHAPEHYQQLERTITASELTDLGVWNDLEGIYALAQRAGDRQLMARIDQFAGKFQGRYGLGPVSAEQGAARFSAYTKHVGESLKQTVDADIRRAFGPQFANASPANQQELLKAVQLEINELTKDRKLGAELVKLSKNYSWKEGSRVYHDVLIPMIRARAQHAILGLKTRFADLFKAAPAKAKAQTAAQARLPQPTQAKRFSMAEETITKTLGQIAREQFGALDESNPLPQDEAGGMSDMDILNSNRAAKLRQPHRPGSELD